jgi:hypothetical protein
MRYLREEEPVRAGEFFNILSGFRVVPRVNELEKEFTKLNVDPYRFFVSTGDKIYDRAVIEASRQFVEPRITKLIGSDRYNSSTDREKKVALANTMQDAMSPARAKVQGKMLKEDRERVDKMAYNALSQEKRLAINEMYKRDNDGKTIEDTKDYKSVYRYAPRLEALR